MAQDLGPVARMGGVRASNPTKGAGAVAMHTRETLSRGMPFFQHGWRVNAMLDVMTATLGQSVDSVDAI